MAVFVIYGGYHSIAEEKKAYCTWFADLHDKTKTENQRIARWYICEALSRTKEEIIEENVIPIDN